MTRLLPAAALLALSPLAAAAQDAVDGMCRETASAEVCACATEALRNEASGEDYALYQDVAAAYLSRMQAGEGRIAAWDGATAAAASARGTTPASLQAQLNAIGRAHRSAIAACR